MIRAASPHDKARRIAANIGPSNIHTIVESIAFIAAIFVIAGAILGGLALVCERRFLKEIRVSKKGDDQTPKAA